MNDKGYKLIAIAVAGALTVSAVLYPEASSMLYTLAGFAAGLFGFQLPKK